MNDQRVEVYAGIDWGSQTQGQVGTPDRVPNLIRIEPGIR